VPPFPERRLSGYQRAEVKISYGHEELSPQG
jgi:hypothetical protein